MKALFLILSRLKPGGWILSIIAFAAIGVFAWKGIKATIITPAVLKATEPLNIAISELQADTTQLNEALAWQIKENENYADSLAVIAAERTQTVEALQRTIQQVESRRRALQQENAQLAKGVRVDLVTLTYRDRIFGKDKSVDSTYLSGWKWGLD